MTFEGHRGKSLCPSNRVEFSTLENPLVHQAHLWIVDVFFVQESSGLFIRGVLPHCPHLSTKAGGYSRRVLPPSRLLCLRV